ncbi:hypothetical protein HAX54_032779, partial [Datura stramonium]|nr:hypothetical protein [Datura stramonium]
ENVMESYPKGANKEGSGHGSIGGRVSGKFWQRMACSMRLGLNLKKLKLSSGSGVTRHRLPRIEVQTEEKCRALHFTNLGEFSGALRYRCLDREKFDERLGVIEGVARQSLSGA